MKFDIGRLAHCVRRGKLPTCARALDTRPKANHESAVLWDPSLTSMVDPDKIIQLTQRNFAIALGLIETTEGRISQ
jgi:hypothetical protein